MLKADFLFKRGFMLAIAGLLLVPAAPAQGVDAAEFRKHKTSLYKDAFENNIYYEAVNYLHLDRLYRAVFRKEAPSRNINRYDEVPDSEFFTNRHARERLSQEELGKGPHTTNGPDTSGKLTVIRGKFTGLHPGFFVSDSRGDVYLVKFDPVDNFELATGAEIVSSRVYHALGYNVPQYTITYFTLDQLQPAEDATLYDSTGFKKPLTQEKLEEILLFVPQDDQGRYRASASKLIEGDMKGYFSFHGRRGEDPEDPILHRHRREVRALQVFGSWLNNYDTRDGNTLDAVVERDGKKVLKHYLIDFNGALGSGTDETKPPMFTHEHMLDYGESFKAFLSLGWWKKPWQKRWEEIGEEVPYPPAVGYLDNRYFDPADFKTQLPFYAFKNLTRADGFWAAKQIMAFTDEDIRTVVKAAEYSNPEAEQYIANFLIERRDIIGRYWFSQANPLDSFDVRQNRLVFRDLAVDYGFEKAQGTVYHVQVIGVRAGGKKSQLATRELREPAMELDSGWFSQYDHVDFLFRTSRPETQELGPEVLVSANSGGIIRIRHED